MPEYCASGNPTKCRVLHTARLQVVDAVGLGRELYKRVPDSVFVVGIIS